ncbi:MAG: hypothetical protein HC784_01550 [Hydrococcus sp. CSU_1_8]|nr:hypothetical protein [Hydrococcus sp. CSU_1_8]
MQEYYIGWHQPNNGNSGCEKFDRCMISVNRIIKRKSPFKVNRWILDSGAFTRISSGKGHLPVDIYALEINRWSKNGDLAAAVVQDYMCESFILQITGLTIKEHQILTIQNYDKLIQKTNVYIMPVLQGYQNQDYLEHLDMYGDRLKYGSWVGVGSICKRNSNPGSIQSILMEIKTLRPDLKLHGFGIKSTSLKNPIIWDLLYSADSQAHGLSEGRSKSKYVRANDPTTALKYASTIERPNQLSIFQQVS